MGEGLGVLEWSGLYFLGDQIFERFRETRFWWILGERFLGVFGSVGGGQFDDKKSQLNKVLAEEWQGNFYGIDVTAFCDRLDLVGVVDRFCGEVGWSGNSWKFQSSRNSLTLKSKSGVVKTQNRLAIKELIEVGVV